MQKYTLVILILIFNPFSIQTQTIIDRYSGKSLEKLLRKPDKLMILDLTINNIKTIPQEIFTFKNLKSLNLRGDLFVTIPPQIKNSQNLENLTIYAKNLQYLPKEIGELKKLETLYIRPSKLTNLPEEIGQLQNLIRLDIYNSHLNKLPDEIGDLKNLKFVTLVGGNLENLPETIGNWKKLEKLELNKNMLLSLPEQIGEAKNLKSISAESNHLKTLPQSIGKLKRLRGLILDKNDIQSLPKEIDGLDSLRGLSVCENQLETIPPEIGNLEQLLGLKLYKNQITTIPPEIGKLTMLRELNLFENQITTIPPEIGHLIIYSLNFGKNQVTKVPKEIAEIAYLNEHRKDFLWGNPITERLLIDQYGFPLSNITIRLQGTNDFVKTDKNGNFNISHFPSDSTLIFSGFNIKTRKREVKYVPFVFMLQSLSYIPRDTKKVIVMVGDENCVALPEVKVWQEGTDNFAKTDENGTLILPNLPNDASITLSKEGFETIHMKAFHFSFPQYIIMHKLSSKTKKKVRGKVMTSKGEFLPWVQISVEGIDKKRSTDEYGNFYFSDYLPQDAVLIFYRKNFKEIKIKVRDLPPTIMMDSDFSPEITALVHNENGKPLSDITIWQEGTDNFVKTDENGFFRFDNLPFDAVLIFSRSDLQNLKMKVSEIDDVAIKMQKK